ncbi:MAG TPA: glycosyltransferase family 87 protein [Anaerolineales bacterium]|nr:glycosyltransferase family 87 protein [Anaerolineales bacterium]
MDINPRRVFTIVGLASLTLIYILLWANMLNDPKQRTGSDFIGFYSFGRIAQTEGFQNIYRIQSQQKVEAAVVGFQVVPELYTHVPLIALLAALIVDSNYIHSFLRWAIVLLLLNAASSCLLVNLLHGRDFKRQENIILFSGIFLFFPTFSALMNGQDDAILLLGLAIWLWGLSMEKPFLAGLGLSLSAVRPQTALFLSIPFLFKERRVFWGFALGGAILGIISWALIKTDGMLSFLNSLQLIESTIWTQPHALDMPTLSGIIRRNFEVIDITFVSDFIWGCYLAGIALFCLVWHKSQEILEKQIGLLALCSILLVPYAHYHDLVILLIPILCLLRILASRKIVGTGPLSTIPLIVSLIALAGFVGPGYLKFPLIYCVMLIVGCLLLFPDRIKWQLDFRKGESNA